MNLTPTMRQMTLFTALHTGAITYRELGWALLQLQPPPTRDYHIRIGIPLQRTRLDELQRRYPDIQRTSMQQIQRLMELTTIDHEGTPLWNLNPDAIRVWVPEQEEPDAMR